MISKAILLMAALTLTAGCAGLSGRHKNKPDVTVYYAKAVLVPTQGQKAAGVVKFSEAFGKVKVEAEITGLDANSQHGFHIHEFGDCTALDATSAGGHYNPGGHEHGSHESEKRHVGDMGNLTSGKKGRATLSVEITNASINGLLNPIIGRGVIVHKNPDDLISQPTGGAGPRIACGVIGATSK